MLAKPYRITQSEFTRFAKRSRFAKSDIFLARFLPNHKNYSQYAVVISKKVAKLATDRNRQKRLVRTWIHENIDKLPKGLYIAVFINGIIKEADKTSKKQILLDLLSKLGVR